MLLLLMFDYFWIKSKAIRKDIYDEDRERLLVTCHISKYILSWTLDLRRHVSC